MKPKRSRRRRNPNRQEGQQAFFTSPESGNTSAFFQPKLEIDPIDSPAEREADAAAHQVVNNPKQTARDSQVQRMGEEEMAAKRIQKQEEEEAAAKLIHRQEEEEAAAKHLQKQEEEEAAAKLIHRQEEEEPAAKRLQRREKAAEEEASHSQVEHMIQMTKGQGMALPDDVRQEMEAQFGADFSRVRIHTDPQAVEMAQMLQAHAFTHGYDIYFNEGRFDPRSQSGKELLAHELAHVVQQKGRG